MSLLLRNELNNGVFDINYKEQEKRKAVTA